MTFDSLSPIEKHLPPGRDHLLATLIFRVRSAAREGTSPLRDRTERLAGEGPVAGSGWVTAGERAVSIVCTVGEGGVLVSPPSGVRPPDIVRCEQDFRDVVIWWETPVAFDVVRVDRDGKPIALLPGGQITFLDRDPPLGEHEYGLVGLSESGASLRTTCRVRVESPRVPAPTQLACEPGERGIWMTWEVPFPCDAIHVLRDGARIAVLPPGTRSYRDVAITDQGACYEVRAVREGSLGEAARCVVNSTFTTRIGDVRAAPGSRGVEVPVYATVTRPIQAMAVGLCCDSPQARVTGWSIEGTLSEWMGVDGFYENPVGAGIVFDVSPPVGDTILPPGIDLHVANALADIAPHAPSGKVVPLRLCDTNGTPAVINVHVARGISLRPRLIDGDLFIGRPEVKTPASFKASAVVGAKAGGAVFLAWRNAERYDRLAIERDGEPLRELPGTAESLVDVVESGQIHHYKLRAFRGERQSIPAVTVYTGLRGGGMFRRGDVNGDARFELPPPGPFTAWFDPTDDALPCDW